jgi:ubiquinone/menaquinone biosynthesis C-methylase UbiE
MNKPSFTWEEAVLWLRDQPDQQELVRACYYDDPLLESAMRYEASDEWKAVLQLLPRKTGKALDLGAGRGISSYALAKAGWQVDALEPDSGVVVGRGAVEELVRESALPIQLLEGFAEQIPAQDGVYDLVYGRQVMHHARNLQTMCDEIARVLKPGGTFISTREHVISKKEDLPIFLHNHALHHLYGGENAYLLQEYINAITNAGLQIRRVLGMFDTPINYFPLTKKQWQDIIQTPIVILIGWKFTHLLLDDTLPWCKYINRFLAHHASKNDHTPGRLYVFFAHKP